MAQVIRAKDEAGLEGRGANDDDGSQRYVSRPTDLAAEDALSNGRV